MIDDLEAARKNRERIEKFRLAEKGGREAKERPPIKLTEGITNKPLTVLTEPIETKVEAKPDNIAPLVEPGNDIKVVDGGRASDQLRFGLGLLRDDEVKAFTQAYQERATQYSQQYKYEANYDAYMEILIERSILSNIAKMLKHWINYLDTLQNCQHTRGAKLALSSLSELCSIVDEISPEE